MAKGVQQYKIDRVAALREAFEEFPDLFFSDYRGLTVGQITDLRGQLRQNDARYTVVKNRYSRIALREMGRDGADSLLTGPTAVALVKGDAAAVSRALLDFGRTAPLEVKGGYVDGRLISSQDVVALSRLPSREQLLALLLSAMHGPVRSLAYVLRASVERVARVLQAVADQKAQATTTDRKDTE